MNSALIITGGTITDDFLKEIYDKYKDSHIMVGVDGGCQRAYDHNIPLEYMLGDFDTLDGRTKDSLISLGVELIGLNPEKDMTDTHAALDFLAKKGIVDTVIIGAIGSRMDHSLANLFSAFGYLDYMNITILNETNEIRILEGPVDLYEKDNKRYRYLSLIPIEPIYVDLLYGVKYPVIDKCFSPYESLGVSNEVTEELKLKINYGRFLLIRSNDE